MKEEFIKDIVIPKKNWNYRNEKLSKSNKNSVEIFSRNIPGIFPWNFLQNRPYFVRLSSFYQIQENWNVFLYFIRPECNKTRNQ
jgi:hypothetical protein